MERKGDALVVRLEVEAEADKASIETEVKQLYTQQLAALEGQYEERFRLQSEEIAHHRKTQSSLLHIVETMAEKESINQTFNALSAMLRAPIRARCRIFRITMLQSVTT
jgi:DNA polymerase III delta prime subunit